VEAVVDLPRGREELEGARDSFDPRLADSGRRFTGDVAFWSSACVLPGDAGARDGWSCVRLDGEAEPVAGRLADPPGCPIATCDRVVIESDAPRLADSEWIGVAGAAAWVGLGPVPVGPLRSSSTEDERPGFNRAGDRSVAT